MRIALILPLTLAALTVPALAQQMPTQNSMQRPDPTIMERRRGDDMALVLGLSSAQRPLLDAFLQHPQPPAPPTPPSADAAPPSFTQDLDRMEQDSQRHFADERRHIAAARALYGALNDRQKAVFDALMRLNHDSGPHGPHSPGGPHGPGGPGGPDGPPPPPPAQ